MKTSPLFLTLGINVLVRVAVWPFKFGTRDSRLGAPTMKSILGLILFAFLGTNAYAITLSVDAGTVIGATGITAGTRSFDIVLADGTCADIFSGCNEDADFNPIVESDQTDIANVLITFLMEVDASPFTQSDIFGCGQPGDCRVYSPIGFSEGSNVALTVFGAFTGTNIGGGTQGINPEQDFAASNILTWAIVSPSVVPVPAAVWLFGSALAGLGLLRRRPTAYRREAVMAVRSNLYIHTVHATSLRSVIGTDCRGFHQRL